MASAYVDHEHVACIVDTDGNHLVAGNGQSSSGNYRQCLDHEHVACIVDTDGDHLVAGNGQSSSGNYRQYKGDTECVLALRWCDSTSQLCLEMAQLGLQCLYLSVRAI